MYAGSSCSNNDLTVISTEMAKTSPPAPTTEEVGNKFVQQYYAVLLAQPEIAHRFYGESSVLGRPGPNGHMINVTTLHVSFFTRLFISQ